MNIRFLESNTNLNIQTLQSKKNSSNEKISIEEIDKIAPIEETKEVNLNAFFSDIDTIMGRCDCCECGSSLQKLGRRSCES